MQGKTRTMTIPRLRKNIVADVVESLRALVVNQVKYHGAEGVEGDDALEAALDGIDEREYARRPELRKMLSERSLLQMMIDSDISTSDALDDAGAINQVCDYIDCQKNEKAMNAVREWALAKAARVVKKRRGKK